MKKTNTKDILHLIKTSGAVRRFKDKEVPDRSLNRIIEAGRWSLSILGIQPWRFICIRNKDTMRKIADAIYKGLDRVARPAGIISKLTADMMCKSAALIAVYNKRDVEKRVLKYGKSHLQRARIAELQAIGGSIQNIFLEANSLGIGAIWVDSPAFFEEEINEVLKEKNELIAFVVLGYPKEKPKRSKRKSIEQTVRKIN